MSPAATGGFEVPLIFGAAPFAEDRGALSGTRGKLNLSARRKSTPQTHYRGPWIEEAPGGGN